MDHYNHHTNQQFSPSGIIYVPYPASHQANLGAHIPVSTFPMGTMASYGIVGNHPVATHLPNTIPRTDPVPHPRSLLERMKIQPGEMATQHPQAQAGQPFSSVHPTVPHYLPPTQPTAIASASQDSCDQCRMMLYYDRSRKAPLLPQILDTETTYDWIPDPDEIYFKVPAPILLDSQSFFRDIDDFFTITREEAKRLSHDDTLRFERASRNTDPELRTPLMDQYAGAYLHRISKGGQSQFIVPYAIPERYWVTVEDWIRNPENLPGTIGRSGDHKPEDGYVLGWWSVTTHLWVSDVTWSRDYHLINLLIVLFSFRGRVIIQLWKLIPQAYRSQICQSHPLPWQFRVPNNVAFRCKYDHFRIEDLIAFLIWLIEVAKFPFTDDAVDNVCDWTERVLRGDTRNQFSNSDQYRGSRRTIVREAHMGKPWESELTHEEPY